MFTAFHDEVLDDELPALPPDAGPRPAGKPGATRPPGRPLDPQARLTAARAALARAELAAGLRTHLDGPAPGAVTGATAPGAVAGATALRAEPGGEPRLSTSPLLAVVPDGTGATVAVVPGAATTGAAGGTPDPDRGLDLGPVAGSDRFLPVPEVLAPLFPGGGLARGGVVQVAGSTSVLLALAAAASEDGAWCALAAMPDVGWRAAAGAGLALDRVAVVPRPGPGAAGVVAALVDGFDVLVVGRCPALGERDRRQLGARLRTRGAVLLSTHPWPGAQLVLRATRPVWDGLGHGWGRLMDQELTVRATGRAGAAREREVRILLGSDGIRAPRGAAVPAAVPAAASAPDAAPLLRAV